MRIIDKQLSVTEFKALTNDRPGTFEAVVSVFDNVDKADEVVARGAFAESLATKGSFPIIWAHQWLEVPIGISLKGEETDQGLKFKGRLFVGANQRADEVWHAMKEGALKEWSFGAGVMSERQEERDGKTITVLEKLDLVEFGPCLRGVNPNTYTVGVKAAAEQALTQLAKTDDDESQESESVPTGNSQETSTSELLTVEQKRALYGLLF